ncbi:hypothetical protein R3P38DRAFT_2612633 [Favolaschia claudopus]|uniref:F-box domain-containing protein n=1 Tax=Favolaschia claudopus TaxID=2862362 RepID=A0AAW0CKZ7_9AGAR
MDPPTAGLSFTSKLLPTATQIAQVRNCSRAGILPVPASDLHAIVVEAPEELIRYDAEITKLQNGLDRLVLERTMLASYADGCRSVLAPVQRLPNELLADIFEWSFPEELYVLESTPEEEVDRISQWHLRQLAQVCCRWYSIAMATPKLWSTIAVDTSLWSDCNISIQTLLTLLDYSLTQGQNHPLTLDVVLTKHAHRWRDVFIWSDGEPHRYLANATGSLDYGAILDRLEMLEINLSSNKSWNELEFFYQAPRLTEFSFAGRLENMPKIPWHQITKCSYHSDSHPPPPYQRLSVLLLANKVDTFTLELDLRNFPLDHDWHSYTSSMRHIEFELATNDSRVFDKLLDSLTLPSLESFSLAPLSDYDPPAWSSNRFVSLASRSQFGESLTCLCVHAMIAHTELVRCLQAVPRLEKLVLADCVWIDDDAMVVITHELLQLLTYTANSSQCLLPRLHTLHMTSLLEFTDASFLDLVASRMRKTRIDGLASFETKLLCYPERQRDMSPETLQQLAQMVASGALKLTVLSEAIDTET